MRNRAKCKHCSSIIESFLTHDYIECKCGEIAVSGGEAMKCAARNWENFIRIDDAEKEIYITVKELTEDKEPGLTKKELIDMLSAMSKSFQRLPDSAMSLPITHYDYASLLILLSAIFEVES
jgi:hypothetical protein